MAKLDGIDSLQNAFSKIISQIDSAETMRQLGGFVITTIKNRTRGRGQGVATPGGNASKLRRVTDKYAKWRQTQPRHPDAATGRASNLTFTGKMLDALIIKRAIRKQLFIGFRSQKEADKSVYQEEQGRRFLVLSRAEIKSSSDFVNRLIRQRP